MGRGGCDKTAIVPALICIAILYVLVSGICIFLAVTLIENEEATIAFGGGADGAVAGNEQAAVTLVFVAVIMCPLSAIGAYGGRAHNKFLLVAYCGAACFSC